MASSALLAGCQGSDLFSGVGGGGAASGEATRAATSADGVQRIDRDIEAPDVYQATEQALWDGRPSFGGVWVAAPDVTSPERVLIRNTENGKSVVGALFKRERDNPGPVMQLSSDAAVALGVLAGAPTEVDVVALKQQAPEEPAAPAVPLPEAAAVSATGEALLPEAGVSPAAPAAIEAMPLDADGAAIDSTDDVLAAAAAAVDAVEATPPAAVETAAALEPTTEPAVPDTDGAATLVAAEVAPEPQAPDEPLTEPYIQVALFSDEANAMAAASELSKAGLLSTILSQNDGEAKVWRVIVGPAANAADRAAFVRGAWDLGYTDTYPVKG